ncbi:hypothetical protein KQX64_22320 [Rhodopseudomonas palustris]|nr:hypothetical protein KQX64_22320 [Rhodopseudomonas palustris]
MVGAAESERFEHMVGVTDEVPIGEEQQLDDVPPRRMRIGAAGERSPDGRIISLKFMSAMLTYQVFMLQNRRPRRNNRLFRLRPLPVQSDKGSCPAACMRWSDGSAETLAEFGNSAKTSPGDAPGPITTFAAGFR